jgi:putative salt-induced outer membrane protein YdiY
MKLSVILIVVCATVTLSSPAAGAENRPQSWQPVAPDGLPTDFDWIRLPSDEWLKGEIISMYDRELEFDSDELGDLTFDFDDIKEIRTSEVVQVGFVDRDPAIGHLILDGDTARVISATGEAEFPRGEVHTLIAGDRKETNYWSADVTLGGNIRSGNTDQVDYTARLGAIRRSLKTRVVFNYLGNITALDDVNTANNHRATLGWDYFLSDRLFVNFIKGQWYRDEFQNVRNRYTVGGGVGYEIIDTPRISWTLGAGPAWQSTQFVSVEPGDEDTTDGFAFNISSFFGYDVTSDIEYYFNYSIFFTDEANGSFNHHLDTGLDIDLIGNLDLNIAWVWDRIQDPRPIEDGSVPKPDDYRLTFGLGWDF